MIASRMRTGLGHQAVTRLKVRVHHKMGRRDAVRRRGIVAGPLTAPVSPLIDSL